MKPKSVILKILKTPYLIVACTVLMASACNATEQITNEAKQTSKPSHFEIKQSADCPDISSKNWSAKIEISDQGILMLSVKGDIELPGPAYTAVLELGKADSSAIPSQHFNLRTERHDGMVIQVITPMALAHSAATISKQYRSIIIYCGEQVIATIDNVTAP